MVSEQNLKTNYMFKSVKQFMRELFSDDNQINEKSFVGFIAFVCMIIALFVDLLTGAFGKELLINEFIFDGFMVIVLGSLDRKSTRLNSSHT